MTRPGEAGPDPPEHGILRQSPADVEVRMDFCAEESVPGRSKPSGGIMIVESYVKCTFPS